MKNPVKIKYVAGELYIIIGRKLEPQEWSRIGGLCRQHSVDELNEALDELEDKLDSGEFKLDKPVGLFQYLLSYKRASAEGKRKIESILKRDYSL